MGRDGDQRMALMGALFDSWNLDEDQRASLKDSFDAMRDDMKSLKETDFDSREARKAAFKELRETQHERLAKVLNDDQIKVLDMMHQRDKRGPKMAERQQREGMKALLASWNLSDDQMQALKEVRKEMRDEMHDSMKEMHDDMQDAMKDADTRQERVAARQEMRKEMKEQRLELRQEGREKLADVLSAEQLDALEAFMANGMRHGEWGLYFY
ncbi:Spy/CpxP family protein refolding chaperone [Cobetia sp. ICG0124]|uniref:Spy/CpxP family protein refolding chaperone n=1 Tax=Cobetia sp. ICG0124 TaxID=2053669 RepID=UPI0013E37013|nr:Spy/CpxP family protein refolding chaperone [Cobetia sp. ICG0124]